ncbi:ankyrin repeat domain-containing protein [Mucilaginibacter mali]|uniref:Ankyrin repeat domain-containing protein n=1 Tax=Mucilaginibacter mali TaxID=2740462 RepID=A0A7D4QA28_9SPHI|nr:ankyrin repeat domain-containing protein [Mucilaginibacter mali]QKJ30525.1 ankyrin repeat domain-containing protein [Mucilaginibacter mali]
MPDFSKAIYHIETHSVEGLRAYFKDGGDPNGTSSRGVPLFTWMVEMYARGPKFKDCVREFIAAGLVFDDNALLAVLAHNPEMLQAAIAANPDAVTKTYFRYKNTYTPLTGGMLMHYCAEYNSLACAEILLQHGADVNARAAIDAYGFGGHTPVFHTVNQNGNNSVDMMHFLLDNGADLNHQVKGLVWGQGYEWETFIPAVNPISYAMMGLLPQVHRTEKVIMTETIPLLIKHAYGIDYMPNNVPNAYLRS